MMLMLMMVWLSWCLMNAGNDDDDDDSYSLMNGFIVDEAMMLMLKMIWLSRWRWFDADDEMVMIMIDEMLIMMTMMRMAIYWRTDSLWMKRFERLRLMMVWLLNGRFGRGCSQNWSYRGSRTAHNQLFLIAAALAASWMEDHSTATRLHHEHGFTESEVY